MSEKNHAKRSLFNALIFACAGLLYLLLTDPQHLMPLLLIVPFILFFLALYYFISWAVGVRATKSQKPMQRRKKVLFTVLAAAYPVILLLLGSIGELVVKDVIILSLLVIVSAFYIARLNLEKR